MTGSPTSSHDEYARLLAEREELIQSGISPDQLAHPIDPDNPDPLMAYEWDAEDET
jgi:hypothetical protein